MKCVTGDGWKEVVRVLAVRKDNFDCQLLQPQGKFLTHASSFLLSVKLKPQSKVSMCIIVMLLFQIILTA